MGISMNGPSGIDTAYIIDSLVELEYQRVRRVEDKISDYEVKIQSYSKLKSLIAEVESKASALTSEDEFAVYSANSSDEKIATLVAGAGAVEGSYGLNIYQLAQAEKMVSQDGLVTSQHDALSTFGVTTGTISIDGTEIDIEATDSIQDLRMKINNATDASGNKLSVTASVLMVADDNFRLLLSSREEGSTGIEYLDVTGSTLQDLGIILDAAGSKGNTQQVLQSQNDLSAAFSSLAVGGVIQYAGTDRNGNQVTNLFIKDASSTVDDLLEQVAETFHGMADVTLDGAGKLTLTDKVEGSSKMMMTSFAMGGVDQAFNVTTAGKDGNGVLTTGKDAFFAIDGLAMQSSSNAAEGYISGVTIELNKVAVDEQVQLEMARDLDGVSGKVQELFDAFNEVIKYSRDQTSYADPDDEESKKGALAGDMTVRSIISQLKSVFATKFDLLGGDFSSLASVGVKTSVQTGEMVLDQDKFKSALRDDFNGVMGMFITKGFADTNSIVHGRHTTDTQRGKYILEEVDADHMRIQLEGDPTWYTSDTRSSDVVRFSDGPAKGLAITAPSGSTGGGQVSYTFSKGFAELLSEVADKVTNSSEGTIFLRQETWRRSIGSSQDRITRLEANIEKFRLRLVMQFSNMERTLNDMRSQSANMMGALGYAQ